MTAIASIAPKLGRTSTEALESNSLLHLLAVLTDRVYQMTSLTSAQQSHSKIALNGRCLQLSRELADGITWNSYVSLGLAVAFAVAPGALTCAQPSITTRFPLFTDKLLVPATEALKGLGTGVQGVQGGWQNASQALLSTKRELASQDRQEQVSAKQNEQNLEQVASRMLQEQGQLMTQAARGG